MQGDQGEESFRQPVTWGEKTTAGSLPPAHRSHLDFEEDLLPLACSS